MTSADWRWGRYTRESRILHGLWQAKAGQLTFVDGAKKHNLCRVSGVSLFERPRYQVGSCGIILQCAEVRGR